MDYDVLMRRGSQGHWVTVPADFTASTTSPHGRVTMSFMQQRNFFRQQPNTNMKAP